MLLDEVTVMGHDARPLAQNVLDWRQRTDPIREFHSNPPYWRRQVPPHDPRPPKDKQSSESNKQHKSEVKNNDGIRQDARHARRHDHLIPQAPHRLRAGVAASAIRASTGVRNRG